MSPRPTDVHDGTLAGAREWYDRMIAADFERSLYPLERMTLRVWRAGQALDGVGGPVAALLRKLQRVADIAWCNAAMNSELPSQVKPGPGLLLHHGGRSIVLHPMTRIGANADIYHDVTVGVRDERPPATIGDDVFLAVGVRVLGPCQVADGTQVGANAVLVSDTEPGVTYVGIPARPVARSRD